MEAARRDVTDVFLLTYLLIYSPVIRYTLVISSTVQSSRTCPSSTEFSFQSAVSSGYFPPSHPLYNSSLGSVVVRRYLPNSKADNRATLQQRTKLPASLTGEERTSTVRVIRVRLQRLASSRSAMPSGAVFSTDTPVTTSTL